MIVFIYSVKKEKGFYSHDLCMFFFFFSGNEYTQIFGATAFEGTLTPYIANCFKPHVKKCILDGEMLGYHAVSGTFGKCFVTKQLLLLVDRHILLELRNLHSVILLRFSHISQGMFCEFSKLIIAAMLPHFAVQKSHSFSQH